MSRGASCYWLCMCVQPPQNTHTWFMTPLLLPKNITLFRIRFTCLKMHAWLEFRCFTFVLAYYENNRIILDYFKCITDSLEPVHCPTHIAFSKISIKYNAECMWEITCVCVFVCEGSHWPTAHCSGARGAEQALAWGCSHALMAKGFDGLACRPRSMFVCHVYLLWPQTHCVKELQCDKKILW